MNPGGSGVAGILAQEKPLERRCHGQPVNGYFALDRDGPERGDPVLSAAQLQSLQDLAQQVAACGGTLKAVAFSISAANTTTLGEAEFPTSFGTDTARLIKANSQLTSLMNEVKTNLSSALRSVSLSGNDVIAQLQLAQQFQSQEPKGQLYVVIATDGVSTLGPVPMDNASFTRAVAEAAGSRVPVPSLSGAHVLLVGVGRLAASHPALATGLVWNLDRFYKLACQRTGASNCQIDTD